MHFLSAIDKNNTSLGEKVVSEKAWHRIRQKEKNLFRDKKLTYFKGGFN